MLRDVGGLLVLLVMPAALILIMALVQDAPFRDYQDLHLKILVADEDSGALSATVRETLGRSKAFTLAAARSATELRRNLRNGQYSIGLIIPKGATAEVVNAANTVANKITAQTGATALPTRPPRDSIVLLLLFDPVSRPAFRVAIHSALDKALSAASTKLLISRINRLAGNTDSAGDFQSLIAGPGIREEQLETGAAMPEHVNSVQHNVPAWAIFGMFFIVVPLSGHIIREREDGSALRVRLIPGAASGVAMGRILSNAAVCCLQFVVMCGVGRWLLPFTGLPALTLGAHPLALVPVIVATALCATAFGNLTGILFRSSAQALPFGAISIVILSALGGIWVPVELLPPLLQNAARVSPLHWSLQGIEAVILRDGGWGAVAVPTLALTILAICLWALSIWRERGQASGF